MQGPGGAFVAISFQLLVGTYLLMYYTFLRWKIIDRGYYRSTLWVLWPLTAITSAIITRELRWHSLAVAGAMGLFLLALYSQRPLLEWLTATVGAGLGVGLVVEIGRAMCGGQSCGRFVAHAALGTFVMGAVTHGMTLGHWYLNQARLPVAPLKEASLILFASLVLSALAGTITRGWLTQGTVPGGLFPFPSTSYWWVWMMLLASTLVLGWMVFQTVKTRSTQSATGLLYIAIVTALGGQFILDLLVST